MMSDEEIRASYTQAKDRRAQVQILADLNVCEREEMERHLVRLGLIRDTPPPSFDWLRAAELYAEGKSDLDIAEQMGCSRQKVAQWRKAKKFNANYPKRRAPAKARGAAPTPRKAPPPTKDAPVQLSFLLPILTQAAQICEDVRMVGDAGACRSVSVEISYNLYGNPQQALVRLLPTAERSEGAHAQ